MPAGRAQRAPISRPRPWRPFGPRGRGLVFDPIGRSIKQELGPVTERLTEASKTLERYGQGEGPGGSKGLRAAVAGTGAAGGAVGGMAGGAFYAGAPFGGVTSRHVEQLQTQ